MDFKKFLKEALPTNHTGAAIANYTPYLFPSDDDTLTQDFQTPAETGLAKWQFSGLYPVMKVSLQSNKGDGPSIDSMVAASDEYTDIMNRNVANTMKKNFSQFTEEASPSSKDCPKGEYYCTKRKKCMPIPSGYRVGWGGWLKPINGKKNGNGNGNGNGSRNGNGSSNGNGGGNGGGNGNGGGGNGGGE